MSRFACVIGLVLFVSSPVQADFVELSHPVFGPTSLTLDTDTGLTWLDITESAGWSYNNIVLEFGPGGDFEGFRHATVAELVSLWNSAGIPCPQTLACDYNSSFDDPPNAGADLLLSLHGWTQTNADTFVAEGIVAEPGPIAGEHYRGDLEGARFFPNHTQVGFPGGLPDSHSSSNFGHWLVVIPEPSTGALLAFGLTALAAGRRRR